MRTSVIAAALAFYAPMIAQAADNAVSEPVAQIVQKTAEDKDVFAFNYGVPTSTALDLIGAAPDKMITSTALKPFTLQLPSSFGNIQGQSLGLDIAPALLAGSRTSKSYVDGGYLHQLAYRAHLAVAGSQGTSSSDPTKATSSKLGLGLSASLLNSSDPLFAHFTEKESAWNSCLKDAGPLVQAELDTQGDPVTAADTQKLDQAVLAYQALAAQKARLDSLDAEVKKLVQRVAVLDTQISKTDAAQANTLRDIRNDIAQDLDSRNADRREILMAVDPKGDIDDRLAALKTQGRALTDKVTADITAYNKTLQVQYATTAASKAIANCANRAGLAARYATDLEVGGGQIWNGAPGKLSHFKSSGHVVWLAMHTPLGSVNITKNDSGDDDVDNHWQAGLSIRSSWKETVATGDKTTPIANADIFDGWGGLQYLGSDTVFGLQVGYQHRRPDIALASFKLNRWRYMGSLTQRLGKDSGTWLSLSYGDTSDDTLRNNQQVLVTVSFTQPKSGSIFGIK